MSWHGWSIEPPLLYVAVAGLLYWAGGRRSRSVTPDAGRTACFAAGLLSIVLALDSPIDGWADKLFWMHMFQHVVLLTVAPPLILLGRPWPRMWLAIPRRVRTPVGRGLARSPLTAPIRSLARPLPAWVLFNATLVGWHIPGLYNATLSSGAVHQLEHAMFFFTGLLFWAHVVDPGPLRRRISWPARAAYVTGAMTVGWLMAIVLVTLQHPLYSHYAHLISRPGGLSALSDQELAGGMMWVPGSITYSIAIFVAFYRWLTPDAKPASRVPAITT